MKHGMICGCLVAALLLAGCGGRTYSLETGSGTTEECSFAQVEEAIRDLTGAEDSYLLLAPDAPIGDSIYLQAMLPYSYSDDGLGYIVEICLENALGYTFYEARTTDIDQVIRCFSQYYHLQKLPNIAVWEDVTDDDWWYDDYGDWYDEYGGYDEYDDYDDDQGGWGGVGALHPAA